MKRIRRVRANTEERKQTHKKEEEDRNKGDPIWIIEAKTETRHFCVSMKTKGGDTETPLRLSPISVRDQGDQIWIIETKTETKNV